MKKIWIVVANSSYGKIYRADSIHTLTEILNLEHAESHMAGHDLTSDRPGRTNSQFYPGTHAMDGKTSPKIKERHLFAQELGRHLTEGFRKGEFERLYVIAPPPFLGCLREEMESHVAGVIFSEIHKDLTHLTASKIREYLPHNL